MPVRHYIDRVPTMRLFASAREAAGTGSDEFVTADGATVGDVLAAARQRYGQAFSAVLPTCRIWVNGDSADSAATVGPNDEIAVLPPVSGGAT
jgi:molybdopterin converting factor small subunit